VLVEQIDIKYSNKVLQDVGLCISFYDFLDVQDPYIYPAEGSTHQFVKFRMIIFRPFIGEILVGRIASSNADGIKVSMEFFDDILIPAYLLRQPAEFRESVGMWLWKFTNCDGGGDDDAGGETAELQMERDETIRFRVKDIKFNCLSVSAKGVQVTTTTESRNSLHRGSSEVEDGVLRRRSSSSVGLNEDALQRPALQVIGSTNEDGLGLVSWWT
jgi:DNA-directed RNA polymerase III subunit RPC8